jgi:hypothetical protein
VFLRGPAQKASGLSGAIESKPGDDQTKGAWCDLRDSRRRMRSVFVQNPKKIWRDQNHGPDNVGLTPGDGWAGKIEVPPLLDLKAQVSIWEEEAMLASRNAGREHCFR